MYYEGRGVERDFAVSKSLLVKAAEGTADEAGEEGAAMTLAEMYHHGNQEMEIEVDLRLARSWYKNAKDMGFDPDQVETAIAKVDRLLVREERSKTRIADLP